MWVLHIQYGYVARGGLFTMPNLQGYWKIILQGDRVGNEEQLEERFDRGYVSGFCGLVRWNN